MHTKLSCFFAVFVLWIGAQQSWAQEPDSLYRRRVNRLAIASGSVYGAGIIGLDRLWYANHPRSSFHFFNDNNEWLQMDKAGHAYWAFQMSDISTSLLTEIGMPRRKAIWIGGLTGLVLQTPIEVLDGFSAAWGASMGDMAANAAGSAIIISQNLLWDEVRVRPKFSYVPSSWPARRPEALGSTYAEQFLKDYNAQTYWLSVAPAAFIPKYSRSRWSFLAVAVGYGIDEMLYAEPQINKLRGYSARRQFYLSPDIDWSRINTRRQGVKWLLKGVNMIKIPFPALTLDEKDGFYFSIP